MSISYEVYALLTYEQKQSLLIFSQRKRLDLFLSKGAITRQEHNKCIDYIYNICKSSDEIKPGDSFNSCITVTESLSPLLTGRKIICCGQSSDDEILFRTEDGRFYFFLQGYWGSRDGILYGNTIIPGHDFKRTTTPETIIDECEADRGDYDPHSWIEAISWKARAGILDRIINVMKRESNSKDN